MYLLLTLISLGFYPPTPVLAAQVEPIVYSTTTAEVILRAYAVRYGISGDEFVSVAKCESGFSQHAFNKADPNGGSKGVFQFQPETFKGFSKEAGLTSPDVWNPLHNIETAAYMFSKGKQFHWTCWKLLKGGNSPPISSK